MVNINKYIKALLHPAGGHQGSHKAHQAGPGDIKSRHQIWLSIPERWVGLAVNLAGELTPGPLLLPWCNFNPSMDT